MSYARGTVTGMTAQAAPISVTIRDEPGTGRVAATIAQGGRARPGHAGPAGRNHRRPRAAPPGAQGNHGHRRLGRQAAQYPPGQPLRRGDRHPGPPVIRDRAHQDRARDPPRLLLRQVRKSVDALAAAQGLTRDELLEMAVEDHGLSPEGTRRVALSGGWLAVIVAASACSDEAQRTAVR
jgi:hypothetical protein